MRTVDAEDVLRAMKNVVDGGDLDDGPDALPAANEFPRYRNALDLALNHCWRSEWWPDLMRGELRYFRANWLAASTYNKTNEVYDSATQQYFQALRDGITGAGQSPTDSSGIERSAYWAKCLTSYGGSNWVTGTVYAVGTKVFYPVTNLFYQCHTAHTSSGTLVPDATGGNERWGVLTEFDRYVSKTQTGQTVIGDCFDVKDQNPKTHQNWRTMAWDNSENGVQVLEETVRAWVQFRLLRPRLKGRLFSATATYDVGQQVYYPATEDEDLPGNFYEVLVATNAGETPVSNPTKFDQVEIPEIFYAALSHMGAAKVLISNEEEERATIPAQLAEQDLQIEADVIYRQQGRSPSIPMRTY
jgi:hypothetical protein